MSGCFLELGLFSYVYLVFVNIKLRLSLRLVSFVLVPRSICLGVTMHVHQLASALTLISTMVNFWFLKDYDVVFLRDKTPTKTMGNRVLHATRRVS